MSFPRYPAYKPSGVEWLGEVPEHWDQVKMQDFASTQSNSFTNGPFGSDLITSEFHNEGVPVIYIRDLNANGYEHKSRNFVTSAKATSLSRFSVTAGDILFSKVGDPPGYCCEYPEDMPDAIMCQDVIRLRPNPERVVSHFLCLLINSRVGQELIESICVESTRKRFSLGDLKSLRIIIPPMAEQLGIYSYLSQQTAGLGLLESETTKAIDILQERRSALISAAVTGQIDVRGLVPEADAA